MLPELVPSGCMPMPWVFFHMMTLGWPWPFLWQGQICFLMLLYEWQLIQHWVLMYFQVCSNSAYPQHSRGQTSMHKQSSYGFGNMSSDLSRAFGRALTIKISPEILGRCRFWMFINILFSRLSFCLGTAEYNFNFVPHFTRFHCSNIAHVKI